MRSLLYLGLLAVVAGYRLFFDLGRGPVRSDEVIYVSGVDRMLETGDWIRLERLRHGVLEPYLNKPPLYFWLTAITRPMLGSGMAGYRFWSALFGLAGVLATFQLGRHMHGPEVGLLAGLALATNRAFLDHHGARGACMDSAPGPASGSCAASRACSRRSPACAAPAPRRLRLALRARRLVARPRARSDRRPRGLPARVRALGRRGVVPSRSGTPRSHLARLRGAGDDRLEAAEGARRRLLRLVHDALLLAVSPVPARAGVHRGRRVLPRARSQRPVSVVRGGGLDGGAVTRPHQVRVVRLPRLSADRGVAWLLVAGVARGARPLSSSAP